VEIRESGCGGDGWMMQGSRDLVPIDIARSGEISANEHSRALESLNVNGLAVLRGYLRGPELAALQAGAAVATMPNTRYGAPMGLAIAPNEGAAVREFRHPFLVSREAAELVTAPGLLDLTEAFLGDRAIIHHALFQRSFPLAEPILDWHIDCGSNKALNGPAKFADVRLRTILYLSDVTSGGFSYTLGSAPDALATFMPLPTGEPFPQAAVPSEPERQMTVDAPAGTLILFNTHGLHRPEAPKAERLVLNTWFARKDFAAKLPPTLFSLAFVPEAQRDRIYVFEGERGNDDRLRTVVPPPPPSILQRIARRLSA
jgi:hypothetical protein